jgi:hypothetical protein
MNSIVTQRPMPASFAAPPQATQAFRCGNCGAPIVNARAAFCPQCGRALRQQPIGAEAPAARKRGGELWILLLIIAVLIGATLVAGFFQFHQSLAENPSSPGSDVQPIRAPISNTPTDEVPSDLVKTMPFGDMSGAPFSRIDPQRRPVIGFAIRTTTFEGRREISDLKPLYQEDQRTGDQFDENVVMAREGFAIGGIYVVGDPRPQAISIVFLPLDNGGLSLNGGYTSPWFGQPDNSRPTLVGGDGRLVLGIYGARAGNLIGLGLISSR